MTKITAIHIILAMFFIGCKKEPSPEFKQPNKARLTLVTNAYIIILNGEPINKNMLDTTLNEGRHRVNFISMSSNVTMVAWKNDHVIIDTSGLKNLTNYFIDL